MSVFFSRFHIFLVFFFPLQEDSDKGVKLTSRERRFIKFASVEFDGQLYMTPQDFLDSVVEQEARRKFQTDLLAFWNTLDTHKLIWISYF